MSSSWEDRRQLSDAKTMRALAHPVRLALLEALRAEGELTASRAAELLGESPGNMSWHLQTLAKYGFVEEAGSGKGRSRPWRLVHRSFSFESSTAADPDVRAAGEALETLVIEQAFSQFDEWRRRRSSMPEWAQTSYLNNSIIYLTPEELDRMAADMEALRDRYNERDDPSKRPPDARPVRLFGFGHPRIGDSDS